MILKFFKFFFCFLLICSQLAFAEDKLLDKIVAVVNNGVILQSEVDLELQQLQQQAIQSGQRLPELDVLSERVLERLIQEKIQIQHAKEIGIHVDEDTLNRAIRSIARNNSMDVSAFRRALRQDGIDFQVFRNNIRNEITISRVRAREVDTNINVSAREVDALIKRNKASQNQRANYDLQHILIAVPEGATASEIQKSKTRIDQIFNQLNLGADFSQLAVRHSDGAKALEGGRIGTRKLQELPDLFARTIVKLRKNEISSVLRSPNGFHIIKVLDVKNEQEQEVIETKARHILLKTKSESELNGRDELRNLRQQIINGKDFAVIAEQFSDDATSAANGGELPWFKPGEMVPIFEEIASNLQKNELSEPFQSEFGWHIVELLERRVLDSDREKIRVQATEALRKTKSDEEYDLWLRRLRADAYIEIRDQSG